AWTPLASPPPRTWCPGLNSPPSTTNQRARAKPQQLAGVIPGWPVLSARSSPCSPGAAPSPANATGAWPGAAVNAARSWPPVTHPPPPSGNSLTTLKPTSSISARTSTNQKSPPGAANTISSGDSNTSPAKKSPSYPHDPLLNPPVRPLPESQETAPPTTENQP